MNTAILLWGVLFSACGMGYAIYGHRQRMMVPLLCGLGLMIYPYFVSSVWTMVGIGAVLLAVPWFVRY